MKALKVIGKILISIFILILIGVGLIYAFQDKIIASVVTEVEEGYEIMLNYEEVNLSLVRDFPNLSLGIEDMDISAQKDSAQLTKMSELNVSVDFYSLFSSTEPLRIHEIILNDPVFLYEIKKDSTTNWDILLSTTQSIESDTTSGGLSLSLDEYSVKNGHLFYIDHVSSTTLEIINLNHDGSGKLSAEKFDLDTKTSIDTIIYQASGASYKTDYRIKLDAIFQVDTKNSIYSFSNASLNIEDLNMNLEGSVKSIQDRYNIDLSMNEVNSEIKQLLSLIPKDYLTDYKDIETDGTLSIAGKINGSYDSENEVYPSMDINLKVSDGSITYPELPESVENIQLSATVSKEEGGLDKTKINVSPFSFSIGNQSPFQMRLAINNPISGPKIQGEATGNLDFNALNNAMPISVIEKMSGNMKTDVIFDVFYPSITAGKYETAKLNGSLELKNIKIKHKDYPQLNIPQSSASISTENIEIKNLDMTIGRSDISGSLSISKPLNYLSDDGTVSVNTSLTSDLLDLNALTESTSPSSSESPTPATDSYEILNRLIVDADLQSKRLIYEDYDLADLYADIYYKDNNLSINSVSVNYSGNPIQASGNLENVTAYLSQSDATLMGDLSVKSKRFDLWGFMNSSSENTSVNSTDQQFTLPKGMNITVDALVNQLDYDKYALKDLKSTLQLQDQELVIKKGKAGLFNGSINLSGSFTARDNSDPTYDFNYSMDRIDFSSAFANIVTFKKIAPIAEYINGLFSTDLKISGKLDQNLNPDLNSLNASGIFRTLNADIKEYKPLDLIADKIGVKSLSSLDISDTKNFFNIQDGRFTVDPFKVMMKEIDATIEGSHAITGSSMDYTISTIIPREWLNKNSATSRVNQSIGWVEAQAKQYGLNVDAGKNLYVDILLSGSIKNPSVSLQLKDIGGKSIQESVKEKAEQEAKRIQDSLKNVMKQEREKLEDEAKKRVDSLKKAAKDEAEKKVKEIITGQKDSSKNKIKDQVDKTKDEAKEKVENAKKKFNKWNPFNKDD